MRFQLRHTAWKLSPRFLRGWKGSRVVYSMTLVLDAIVETTVQGIVARFPELAAASALNAIGRDRRILRGFDESGGNYRQRLLRWLDEWRRAGHAYAILEQVAGYLSPHACKLKIVTNAGMWYERAADGTLSWSKDLGGWDWDGDSSSWWRAWLIIYPPTDDSLWVEEGTWGDGASVWGEDGTIGTTATEAQIESVRTILRTWKPKHVQVDWIIVSFDWTAFEPSGSLEPDGTWGPWGTDTTDPSTASRLQTARYWDGVAA